MPEMIENRMVVDSEWEFVRAPDEVKEKLNGPGWKNLKSGTFVSDEDAFGYAIEQCTSAVPKGFREIEWTQEFRDMVVEWFYSDDWVKE